jgi:prepilin-type N-terminal cleavage/methylation domain-containing protein
MKNIGYPWKRRPLAAFTLIELLVVIAIIAILAAMIIPVVGAISKRKQITVAQTQLKAIEAAIDGYKTKLGYYPPDNPNNVVTNQLYFELLGTTNDGVGGKAPQTYVTLDGSAQISTVNPPILNNVFGVMGFANSSTRSHSDDSGSAASSFINNLRANEIGTLDPAGPIKILVCSVQWPPDKTGPIFGTSLNPFCYNSSHPTNNASSYDLWVDIVFKGRTNRVCNWSAQPIQL